MKQINVDTSYSISTPLQIGFNETIRYGPSSKTTWKTHALVVMSYLLIGIGIMLSCASLYMAAVFHPVVTILPTIPLGAGVLLAQRATVNIFPTQSFYPGQPLGMINQDKNGNRVNCWLIAGFIMVCLASSYRMLLHKFSQQNELPKEKLPNYYSMLRLITAFQEYQRELEEGKEAISSVKIQALREWLAHHEKIISPEGSQEDPTEFLRLVQKKTGNYLPLLEDNGQEVQDPKDTCILLLFETDKKHTFKELFNTYFTQEGKRWFTEPPSDFLIEIERGGFDFQGNKKSWEYGDKKINIELDCPFALELTKQHCPSLKNPQTYAPDVFIINESYCSRSGHYVTYANWKGQWWLINDQNVFPISINEAEKAIRSASFIHYTQTTQAA